jgi:hypothetical protein
MYINIKFNCSKIFRVEKDKTWKKEGFSFLPDNADQKFQNFLQKQGTGLDLSNSSTRRAALSLFQVTIIHSRNLKNT